MHDVTLHGPLGIGIKVHKGVFMAFTGKREMNSIMLRFRHREKINLVLKYIESGLFFKEEKEKSPYPHGQDGNIFIMKKNNKTACFLRKMVMRNQHHRYVSMPQM